MEILLICRSSRPQVFYKVGDLKYFTKFTGKHQRRSLFSEVVGRRPQAYYFIKKQTLAQVEICKILKNTFFIEQLRTTASGYIRILTAKKFQYHSSLLTSYKEAGRRGRRKLLLPTHINYQRCTLVKGLFKPCY